MHLETSRPVDLTLLVCTYNRSADLRDLLESAVAQETDGTTAFEILVVDNNSNDGTRAMVESFMADRHPPVRYLFEGRQGKSHALNTGLAAVRGWSYVITDDDFVLPPDWVQTIVDAFRRNPDTAFVGGKVLPLWQAETPGWLDRQHWSAVALADYGDASFVTDHSRQVCLLACAFRVADVRAVGGYQSSLGVDGTHTGGVEDVELLQRLWRAGKTGTYVPGIRVGHKVAADRTTRSYHRRWHTGHGRFYARMRDADFERSSVRLFDVPGHMYRRAVAAGFRWMAALLRGRTSEAMLHEARLRFFIGFFQERYSHRQQRGSALLRATSR